MNIPKAFSLKYKIILGLKLFIVLLIFLFLISTFIIDYSRLFKIAINLMSIYLILTLSYFSFYADKEDRLTILNMWKIYFSVITIMIVFLYSMESNLRKVALDYQKTKLNYEIKIKSNDINNTFAEYSNIVTQYLNSNKKEKLIDITKPIKENTKKEEGYTIWYANFAVGVMNIITLFMFLWSLLELKIFQDKKVSRKQDFLKIKH